MTSVLRHTIIALALLWAPALWAENALPDDKPEDLYRRLIGQLVEFPGCVLPDFASRVPMAVPQTASYGADPDKFHEMATFSLRSCLAQAKVFEIQTEGHFFFDVRLEGLDGSATNFRNYVITGSQGLIKAAIRVDDGRIALKLLLFDVDAGERIDLGYPPRVVVAPGDLQSEIRQFTNLVIEYYTGQESVCVESIRSGHNPGKVPK